MCSCDKRQRHKGGESKYLCLMFIIWNLYNNDWIFDQPPIQVRKCDQRTRRLHYLNEFDSAESSSWLYYINNLLYFFMLMNDKKKYHAIHNFWTDNIRWEKRIKDNWIQIHSANRSFFCVFKININDHRCPLTFIVSTFEYDFYVKR